MSFVHVFQILFYLYDVHNSYHCEQSTLKKSILEYGMLTKGHLNLFNNSLSRAKPFNAAVRFLIKYNCHGTQW